MYIYIGGWRAKDKWRMEQGKQIQEWGTTIHIGVWRRTYVGEHGEELPWRTRPEELLWKMRVCGGEWDQKPCCNTPGERSSRKDAECYDAEQDLQLFLQTQKDGTAQRVYVARTRVSVVVRRVSCIEFVCVDVFWLSFVHVCVYCVLLSYLCRVRYVATLTHIIAYLWGYK